MRLHNRIGNLKYAGDVVNPESVQKVECPPRILILIILISATALLDNIQLPNSGSFIGR